jgi:hypothetical protein
MNNHPGIHSFHIPVMGLAFTIDSPIRVAHLGISSVISLGDDLLIERVREFYSRKFNFEFIPIAATEWDARANRITAYLNLVQDIVARKFETHKQKLAENAAYFKEYLDLLPDYSEIKKRLVEAWQNCTVTSLKSTLDELLTHGGIDVNIMTKLDKTNHHKGKELPVEFNDAHASLRAFAHSKVSSSLVLSAGMNPRLYSFMEHFDNFYPDAAGRFNKQIVIKVSDFRSALIQGKFLAKKGLWVSEYRLESGLNCGGHAFATPGKLMGPILEEFKSQREELRSAVFHLFKKALEEKGRSCPNEAPAMRITAQGGVGTAAEHAFLLAHYQLDSVGWGSPFLLVPEAVSIDEPTRRQLSQARESDIYLSNASPLGVPFNNLRGSSRQQEMAKAAARGKTGNPCTKKFLMLTTEFTEEPICTASAKYHKLKIQQLKEAKLPEEEFQKEYNKMVEKECLCGGLSTSFFIENGMGHKVEGKGVTVCPGPNIAYFSGKFSLAEMVGHIYGKLNLISRTDRPHVFIKELQLYLEFHHKQLQGFLENPASQGAQTLREFQANLKEGIRYYRHLFSTAIAASATELRSWKEDLTRMERELAQWETSLRTYLIPS